MQPLHGFTFRLSCGILCKTVTAVCAAEEEIHDGNSTPLPAASDCCGRTHEFRQIQFPEPDLRAGCGDHIPGPRNHHRRRREGDGAAPARTGPLSRHGGNRRPDRPRRPPGRAFRARLRPRRRDPARDRSRRMGRARRTIARSRPRPQSQPDSGHQQNRSRRTLSGIHRKAPGGDRLRTAPRIGCRRRRRARTHPAAAQRRAAGRVSPTTSSNRRRCSAIS